MNCNDVDELLGAYALKALPKEVEDDVRRHLGTCDAHGEAVELRAAAMSLGASTAEREPPPALRGRLLAAIEREKSEQQDSSSRRPSVPLRRFPSRAVAVAASLAVLALGLLGWNLAMQFSDDGGPLVREFVGSAPAGSRVILVEEERLAVLRLDALPPLPADRVYQIWAIDGGRPVGVGTFTVAADGGAAVIVALDRESTDVIAITDEPKGGSEQPTTAPLLTAEL